MKKILFTFALVLFGSVAVLAAQEEEVDQAVVEVSEQIELPDVTTVVNTATLVAGSDSLPDFADVVEISEGSGKIVPQLAELEVLENTSAEVVKQAVKENSIFAEGKIGGGYPIGIYGDFKIYKLNEASPFEFSFLHDSASGYSRTALSDGYNDSKTSINIDKSFVINNTTLSFGVGYENNRNGFQNKVEHISDISQNFVNTNGKVDWNFAKGFNLGSSLNFDYYNRFSDITTLNVTGFTPEEWAIRYKNLAVSPDVYFRWENYGFEVNLDAVYKFDKDVDIAHRAEAGLGFAWKNDYVRLFLDGDFVFGNRIGANTLVVPFDAGIHINFPVKFATRQFGINLAGGMDSSRKSVSEYEKLYKFTGLNIVSNETSDWFGRFEISIPVQSTFLLNTKVEYRQTAFGNGVLQPVYNGTITNGIYAFEYKDRNNLTTDITVNYNSGIFGFSAQWYSNWLYVPALESSSMFNVSFSLQSREAKWNVTLNTGVFFAEEGGIELPLISMTGFVKVTDAVNIAFTADDIINLFGGQPRTYAGQYISRSGSVTAMVKFFF